MSTRSCILSAQLNKILLLLTVIGESKCFKYSTMLCGMCYQSKSTKWSRELFQTDVLVLRVCCAYFARWTFCIVRVLHVKFLFIHASSFSFPCVIILLAKSLYINSERSVASHIKSSCMRDSTSFLIPTPKTCLAAKRKSMNICRQKSALERACFA